MESELPAGELDCEVCPWVVLQSLFVAEIVNPWHLMFVHTQVTCAESKTFASPEIKVVCLLSSAPIFGIPWETTRIPFRSLLQTRRLGQAHARPGTWPDWHFSEPQALSFWIHFQEGTTVDASEIRRSPIETKVQKMTNPHIQKTTTGYLELKRTSPDELFF